MCGKAMKQRRIGDESRLKTILAAVHSMIQLAAAVFLWAVSAMEYRLNLYCERVCVLALTALLTALSAGMVFVKGKLGKLGTTLAVFMPFADAACMFSMMLLYEPTGLICGLWTTACTFAAFIKCVPDRKLRTGAAYAVLALLPVGICCFLPLMHPDVEQRAGEVLLSISMNLLFGFVWLGGGALTMLCSSTDMRWKKNVCGILAFVMFAVQLLVFCVMVELREYGGPVEENPAVYSQVSPDGTMIAELVQDDSDGARLYVSRKEDIDIGIGVLYGDRKIVSWPHYGSAQIGTIEWLDEENILINGSPYPVE